MLADLRIRVSEFADSLAEAVYVTDRQRRIVFWNKGAERITGFSAGEVLGRPCSDNLLVHVDEQGCSLCLRACPLAHTMCDRVHRSGTVFLHHKQGHRVPVRVQTWALTDDRGHVVGGIEVFAAETPLDDLRERIAVLERLALVDPLTQIANRRYLETELAAHLSMLQRTGVPFGVAFLDIDGFKRFNDEHGHAAGDAALQTVARTLTAAVRSHDTVGRWGGEEFVALLANIDVEGLSRLADRLCRMVSRSRVHTPGGTLAVTVSAGATLALAADTPASLLKRADDLMYSSKRSGGNRVVLDNDVSTPECASA